MKKMLLIAAPVLLCFFVSCKDAEKEKADQIKAANAAIYKSIETGDVSKVDSFIGKDAIDHGMGEKDVVGVDSIKKMLGAVHNELKNLKIEVVASAVDGDYSMTLTKTSGTPNAPGAAPIVSMSVDVVKWKDGKGAEHWSYNDPREMMKMMAPSNNAPAMVPDTAPPAKK